MGEFDPRDLVEHAAVEVDKTPVEEGTDVMPAAVVNPTELETETYEVITSEQKAHIKITDERVTNALESENGELQLKYNPSKYVRFILPGSSKSYILLGPEKNMKHREILAAFPGWESASIEDAGIIKQRANQFLLAGDSAGLRQGETGQQFMHMAVENPKKRYAARLGTLGVFKSNFPRQSFESDVDLSLFAEASV